MRLAVCSSKGGVGKTSTAANLAAVLATSAYSPPCSTRISGVLRILPLLFPRVVRMITGSPVSRSVLPR